MRANKVDTNQPQIVKELRDLGYKVLSIADKKNCCDLIVSDGIRNEFFEIKNPEYCYGIYEMAQEEREQFLTEGEAVFAQDFRVFIVADSNEIRKVFGDEN